MRFSIPIAFLLSISIFFGSAAADSNSSESKAIRIGAIFSLSGWGAGGGTPEMNGALLAMEELGDERYLDGREIQLEVEDNRSDLRATADAFRKLTSVSKASVVIGPNWSEFIDVVAPLAVSAKVPVITATGYKEQQVKPDPWVFVLWPPPAAATKTLTAFISARGIKKLHVLLNENAYMRGVFEAMKGQLDESGVALIEVSSFNPGEMNYRSKISKIIRSDADGVLALLLETGELASFMRQRLEQKLGLPIFAANSLPFDPILQKDLGIAEGLVYFDYNTPGGPEFSKRYRAKFNSDPGFGSAKAYDAVRLAVSALRAVGADSAKIRSYLRSARYAGVSGSIAFDDKGVIEDRSSNTHLMKVTGATLAPVPAD